MKRVITICSIAAVILTATDLVQAAILNVPADYLTIQTAVDHAIDGDEVVVADGIYTGTGNRDIDFLGKAITVCSKNGPENCIINCQGSIENEHRGFFFHSGEGENSLISGFTIRNGQTTNGGGICCMRSSPTITNCIISENKAGGWGGGIDCRNSSPTITNCTISGNAASVAPDSATGGGGINCINSSPTIINCTISGNTTTTGGGIGCMRSSPTIINCTISSNTSTHSDGGIGCYWNSSPTITNCIITGNTAEYWAGGIYCYEGSSPTITNCIITNNTANNGGGICCYSSSPIITNCTSSENSASYEGGGICCYSSSPIITNCTFNGNSASTGAGMFNKDSSPTVKKCMFIENHASSDSGGMYNYDSSPTVTNCMFTGNSAFAGGGMLNYDGSPTVTNCTFSGNSVDYGGGMYNSSINLTLTNCTLRGNSALKGGGMYNFNTSPTITNCILWSNTASSSGPQIYGLATVTYSDVQDGWSGTGNINANPLFADADGRLSPGSPCINAGDNSAVLVATDLDGNPRIAGPRVDMGAFEVQPAELLLDLTFEVIDLDLQSGIENSLLAKLDAAQKANDSVAINTLQAFINAVEAQRGNKIPEADADDLIAAAQQIIDLLMAD